MNKIKLGYIPDLPDFRDYKYSDFFKDIKILNNVNLQNLCSPVENQSELGSCTGNSIVGHLEYLENKDNWNEQNKVFLDLSRLFVYYNERLIEGTIKQDSGAMIRDGIKSLVKYGCCKEILWPYNINKFKNKPNVKSYKDAANRKISSYYRLDNANLNDLLSCLSSGYPFVFGFTVYDSFMSDSVAKTGIVNLPNKTEKVQGGHAVLCVGFDSISKRFLVRNSWGGNWGLGGYFTIPFEYLTNLNLADDFWTIRK